MIQTDRCPECGAERTAGICPRCLIRLGIDGPGPGRSSRSLPRDSRDRTDGGTTSIGALETIAATIGPVPRVLLRDTAPGEEPGPIVRPDGDDGDSSIRYRIDGEIARGGMGAILKGRDPDLGRDVALKVLRDDYRDDADMVRRFVEEAQIGGQLQHPGIVPIYELGTFADRRPFFAMKLVKGHTLAQLLEARKGPDDDRPRFLSIFEAVAQTVAYAHARGVIHRDLKPSNVMVGSFGEVQVMDWGLAKVLPRGGLADDAQAGKPQRQETVIATARSGSDGPELSRAGSAMGTPAYMAPEQARGEVGAMDERADIFALGSILCEVLTGEPVFLGRSSGEIMRKAALGDTADALARLDACGTDAELIAIAKNCLGREPEDRPRHAGALAEGVTAYLSGVQDRLRAAEMARAAESARAEEARRTAAAAEARARAERRAAQLMVGLAAAILLLAACGGGAAAWLAQQRQAQRAEVVRLLDRADSALDRGEREGGPAAAGALEEARSALDQADHLSGGQAPATIAARIRTVLERVAVAARLHTLLADLEAARLDLPDVERERTDAAFAAAFRQAGLDIDRDGPGTLTGGIDGRPAPVELASYLDAWVLVRRSLRRPEADWQRLVSIARAIDPDSWRVALRARVWRKDDESAAVFRALADDQQALDNQPAMSQVLLARQLKYAAGDAERAARILRRACRRHPSDFWLHVELARALGTDSVDARQLFPQPQEAERHLTAALALRPSSAPTHRLLGNALMAQGKIGEAEAEYLEAIRLTPDSSAAHNGLGAALEIQGKHDEAQAEHRKAIALARESVRLQPDNANLHQGVGADLANLGDFDGAIAAYRQAIRLQPDFAEARHQLGFVLEKKGDRAGAIAAAREVVRLEPDHARAHNNLAFGLMETGDLSGAMQSIGNALRLDPEHPVARATLAEILVVRGRFAEAVPALEQAAQRLAAAGDHQAAAAYESAVLPGARWLAGHPETLTALTPPDARDKEELTALDLAARARAKDRPALAARLYEVVLAVSPARARDLKAGYRSAAARAAVLAGCGQGKDDPPPDDRTRVKLRGQALGWLRADLAEWSKLLASDPAQARPAIVRTLSSLRADPDLAGVRAADALAKLPETERAAWLSLWAEVDALLARARAGQP
jgi:serine/threonine-protein kinase